MNGTAPPTIWTACWMCAGQGRVWNTTLTQAWICPRCLGMCSLPPRHKTDGNDTQTPQERN